MVRIYIKHCKFFLDTFIILKAPGSNPLNIEYWNIQKPRQNVLLHCYLEDSNQNSSVWKYTKWQNYQWNNLNISSIFEPASFRVDVHDATTELPDSVNIISNSTFLNKTHVKCNTGPYQFLCCTISVGRPYQFLCCTISVGRHFPPKISSDCLPWLQFPVPILFFYQLNSVWLEGNSEVWMWIQYLT